MLGLLEQPWQPGHFRKVTHERVGEPRCETFLCSDGADATVVPENECRSRSAL